MDSNQEIKNLLAQLEEANARINAVAHAYAVAEALLNTKARIQQMEHLGQRPPAPLVIKRHFINCFRFVNRQWFTKLKLFVFVIPGNKKC